SNTETYPQTRWDREQNTSRSQDSTVLIPRNLRQVYRRNWRINNPASKGGDISRAGFLGVFADFYTSSPAVSALQSTRVGSAEHVRMHVAFPFLRAQSNENRFDRVDTTGFDGMQTNREAIRGDSPYMDKHREFEPNLQLIHPYNPNPPLFWIHGD